MKSKKRRTRDGYITAGLFVAAGVLLLSSVAGSSRAALTYFSEDYSAQIEMYDIGITLVENGADISSRNYTGRDDRWDETSGELLKNMLAEGETVQPGKAYTEELTVRNSGTIDHYARVMVYRYWEKETSPGSGIWVKVPQVSPDLIDLKFLTGDNGWVEDPSDASATDERTVLYYTRILGAGQPAPAFTDTLTISTDVLKGVTSERKPSPDGNGTVITTTFDYDGLRFVIEAEADAVQTHNAADAIKSAWGVDVTVAEDGTLVLQ